MKCHRFKECVAISVGKVTHGFPITQECHVYSVMHFTKRRKSTYCLSSSLRITPTINIPYFNAQIAIIFSCYKLTSICVRFPEKLDKSQPEYYLLMMVIVMVSIYHNILLSYYSGLYRNKVNIRSVFVREKS